MKFTIPENRNLKNGEDFLQILKILDKYKELSSTNKNALLLEISAYIGFQDDEMQKRAEHYSKIYFDSIPIKDQ